MFCTEFTFDGIASKEYDLIICSFDGGQSGSATAGSHIEFTTFKAPNSNKWVKTGSTYSEQLTFTFSICKFKCGGSSNSSITERELAFLLRWLVRKDYKYLQFNQEGYENIYYHCQINAEKHEIGGKCYGLNLTVTCDAPFGWSEERYTTISSSTSSTVKLYDHSDEIGIIYPNMIIFSKAGTQDITISNTLTNTEMKIKNCIKDEKITVKNINISSTECYKISESAGYDKISESAGYEGNHATLFKDFNWQWLSIGNTFSASY